MKVDEEQLNFGYDDPFTECEVVEAAEARRPDPVSMATDKQKEYLITLANTREVADAELLLQSIPQFTKEYASEMIGKLRALPKKKNDQGYNAVEGMHKVGDVIYKVQRAVHGSGNLYAKRLEVRYSRGYPYAEFVMARGMVKNLSEKTLMSKDEAQAFGKLYGICCRCARILTDEKSIEAGVGPICAEKEGWS